MNNRTPERWVIDRPLDMHLHLRQGAMLKEITPSSSALFAGAVIMPNLVPPVTSVGMVKSYREQIVQAAGAHTFAPLMTLFFQDYSPEELAEAKGFIFAVKLYPDGVTTNSRSGVRDLQAYAHVLAELEKQAIPLLVHGETHGFVMDREREFMAAYTWLAENFPRLKVVMEHISTREAVELLDRHDNIYATVTLHHLLLTLDDMAGGRLNPHLFCKPLLKTPDDRAALQDAVLSGHPKIMFGSDSAPHPRDQKECPGCAAGIFSAPVALPMLADFFERNGKPSLLQNFVGGNAIRCHNLAIPSKRILLERKSWKVPDRIGDVVPFMAGQELTWSASVVQG